MNIDNLGEYINHLPITPDHRIKIHRFMNLVASDLLAAVEALERLADAAEPITKDDSPDHVFVPSDREWQEFELAQTYARAVLRRLRGEEGEEGADDWHHHIAGVPGNWR